MKSPPWPLVVCSSYLMGHRHCLSKLISTQPIFKLPITNIQLTGAYCIASIFSLSFFSCHILPTTLSRYPLYLPTYVPLHAYRITYRPGVQCGTLSKYIILPNAGHHFQTYRIPPLPSHTLTVHPSGHAST